MSSNPQHRLPELSCLEGSFYEDDRILYLSQRIGQFLSMPLQANQSIEIEAKLGVIRRDSVRHASGSITETVLNLDAFFFNFESKVEYEDFMAIKAFLEKTREGRRNSKVSEYRQIQRHSEVTTDHFYPMSGSEGRVRLTLDENKQFVECIVKTRLDDMHIHMGDVEYQTWLNNRRHDCRISFNVETKFSRMIGRNPTVSPKAESKQYMNQVPALSRRKDRTTYVFEVFRFDLTEVEQSGRQRMSEPQYEIEIEILPEKLAKFHSDPLHLAKALMNNIRQIAYINRLTAMRAQEAQERKRAASNPSSSSSAADEQAQKRQK